MINRVQRHWGNAFSVLFTLYAFYEILQDNDWLLSLWFSLSVIGLQRFTWQVFTRKNLVSFALSFLPSIQLLLFFTHSFNFVYIIAFCLLEILLIIICSLEWPDARMYTYSWLGAAALMFIAAATPALVKFL